MAASRKGGSFIEGKYAPETFIIPGQDQNGNSVREYCRVIPLLDRAIDALFGSKRFPFRSKGDIMRWCLDAGIKRLNEMEPVCGDVLVQADAMIKVLKDEMDNHAFITVFNTMATSVGMHVAANAGGEARRVVAQMIRIIKGIESEYWRNRYLCEIENKFGYLLNGSMVRGVGLGDHDDSETDE